MTTQPPVDTAHRIHTELVATLRRRRSAEHQAALLLRRVRDERLYAPLGYAGVYEYAEQALDVPLRQARALIQIGGMLPSLPALNAAFAAGDVSWTKARELARVVTPETDQAWTARARELTSRELERLVSVSRVGEPPPDDPPEAREPARTRFVVEMEAAEVAVLRDALVLLRTQADDPDVDDGALLAAMGQRVLLEAEEDPATQPPTGERYRVVVQVCPTCRQACSSDAEVSETVQEQARCDGELLDLRDGPTRGHVTRTVPPALRRAVLQRGGRRCVVPGCRCRLWLDLHHLRRRADGGDHSEANLVTLCAAHHRMVHEGLLSLRWRDGRLEVERSDGRRSLCRLPATAPWRARPHDGPSHAPAGAGPPG